MPKFIELGLLQNHICSVLSHARMLTLRGFQVSVRF